MSDSHGWRSGEGREGEDRRAISVQHATSEGAQSRLTAANLACKPGGSLAVADCLVISFALVRLPGPPVPGPPLAPPR